jgi:hypothetical protein
METSRFELKKIVAGTQFMFNLKVGNTIVLTSESFKLKVKALNTIESIKKNSMIKDRFERKTTSNGVNFFVLKAGNGEIIGKSETYSSESAMENCIESVMENAFTAKIYDLC